MKVKVITGTKSRSLSLYDVDAAIAITMEATCSDNSMNIHEAILRKAYLFDGN